MAQRPGRPVAAIVDSLHHSRRPPTIISRGANETVDTMHIRGDETEEIVAVGGRVVTRDR